MRRSFQWRGVSLAKMANRKRSSTLEESLRRQPSRDAVLTELEVAEVLQISVDKVLNAHLPTIYFGRDKRYVWGVVVDFLAERANDS